MLDINTYFESELAEHARVVVATREKLAEPFAKLVEVCTNAVRREGKLLFFGNGGSAADAQHLATELTVRYVKNREPIAAIALTTDTSALTAIGNDFGFEQQFARQVAALGKPDDVAIGISTSGRSANVIQALRVARERGIVPAALTGKAGGDLLGLAEPILVVPSDTTSRIQEMHIMLGQMLCGALERGLGLV